MKKFPVLAAAVVAAAVTLGGCEVPPPPAPATLTAEDLAANEAITKAWETAANAGDWAAAAALYSTDAVLMPSEAPAVTGRAAVEADLRKLPPGVKMELRATSDGVGNVAYTHGSYTMTIPQEAGEPMVMTGKYLEIRRKQADGSWLITHDIYNGDAPSHAH